MKMNETLKKRWTGKSDRKSKSITIRISDKNSRWLRKHNLSPTAIYETACKELGYK